MKNYATQSKKNALIKRVEKVIKALEDLQRYTKQEEEQQGFNSYLDSQNDAIYNDLINELTQAIKDAKYNLDGTISYYCDYHEGYERTQENNK